MLSLRLQWLWLGIGALGIGLAFLLSLWPHGAPGLENVPDKVQHLTGYAMVGLWFGGLVRPRYYLAVCLGAVLLGGAIELLQGLTSTRQADWADEWANASGALLGVVGAVLGGGGWARTLERFLGFPAAR